MKRRSVLTEKEVRDAEYQAGFRRRSSQCRMCKAELTTREQPEGVCDRCLRSSASYVRTDA
jgi:hypothetical protein